MKITIMALHLGYGGVEKYIITIANILSEKYDVEIISTYKITKDPSFPLNKNIKVRYLITNMRPNKLLLDKAIKDKNIFKMIKEGYYSFKLLRMKKKRNIESIKNCTSDIIISTREFHNELIQKYANEAIVKITSEHNHHNNNQEYVNKVIHSCNQFDYMLPISKELTSFYKEKLPNVNVEYIPFCIEEPKQFIQPTFDQNIYISVGRLSPEKGSLTLIDIFNGIKKKQSDAILHIVGDGPLKEQMKMKIKQYSLGESIILHGFKDKDIINDLYSKSSLYLMTSFTESFGFVLLEAMASGIPCIAFDSAQGANEIIKEGINGYLIKDRNEDDYINKVMTLMSNKEIIHRMSLNARECINEYSFNNTKKYWIELIETIKKEHSI